VTIPVAAVYQAYVQAPTSKSYAVTGDCTGTEAISRAPLTAATFEGVTGSSATLTRTASLSGPGCNNGTTTEVWFYDASGAPIGVVTSANDYRVYQQPLVVLPATAKVGDTGPVAKILGYTDSTGSVLRSIEDVTFDIAPDGTSTTTALLELQSRRGWGGRTIQLRVDTTGAFSLIADLAWVNLRGNGGKWYLLFAEIH
jgi:hypothetical protein